MKGGKCRSKYGVNHSSKPFGRDATGAASPPRHL